MNDLENAIIEEAEKEMNKNEIKKQNYGSEIIVTSEIAIEIK